VVIKPSLGIFFSYYCPSIPGIFIPTFFSLFSPLGPSFQQALSSLFFPAEARDRAPPFSVFSPPARKVSFPCFPFTQPRSYNCGGFPFSEFDSITSSRLADLKTFPLFAREFSTWVWFVVFMISLNGSLFSLSLLLWLIFTSFGLFYRRVFRSPSFSPGLSSVDIALPRLHYFS